MTKRLALCAAVLVGVVCVFGLSGCGNSEPASQRNRTPVPPGRQEGS